MVERAATFFAGGGRSGEPVGAVNVADPTALNWLYITHNTEHWSRR